MINTYYNILHIPYHYHTFHDALGIHGHIWRFPCAPVWTLFPELVDFFLERQRRSGSQCPPRWWLFVVEVSAVVSAPPRTENRVALTLKELKDRLHRRNHKVIADKEHVQDMDTYKHIDGDVDAHAATTGHCCGRRRWRRLTRAHADADTDALAKMLTRKQTKPMSTVEQGHVADILSRAHSE